MTLGSALAGGDCIDDADVLRTGGTAAIGSWSRRHPPWAGASGGLDRVSRELLWAAGAGPGDGPLTIDLDSTTETYGRQGGSAPPSGLSPLLAVAAGTGDVLMARLREGRANTAGAAHFLRETVGRVRYAGEQDRSRCGPTAASTPTHRRALPQDECSLLHHHPPDARLRNQAIPETDCPIPYWMDGAASSPTPPFKASPTPRRCGSSSGG